MRRTFRRTSSLVIALFLAVSLAVPAAALAQDDSGADTVVTPSENLETREAFELGRFRDHSDWGDYSSLLTQSLVVLALARTPDATPPSAAIDLLLAQQCDDGGFPDAFRSPSTEGPGPCDSAVDTTAYVVQALDAVDAQDAVTRAVDWLTNTQSADGSFGAADGTNTNSTGLAAVALRLGGQDAAAAAAQAWVYTQQDGCDTASPGAIPFSLAERGVEVVSTAQVLQGLTGTSLATVSARGADPTVPDNPCAGPDGQIDAGNGIEAAGAWLASVLTEEPAIDTGFGPSEGATADALLGFAAAGIAGETIEAMADWLETRVGPYTQGQGFDAADAVYAGATAKLLLTMDVAGRSPHDTAGTDLVEQLLGREITDLDPVDVSCEAPSTGVVPGTTVPCELTGLIPLETVHLQAQINPVVFDEHLTADDAGAASFDITVPNEVGSNDTLTVTVDGFGVPALATRAIPIDLSDDPDDDDDPGQTPGDEDDEQAPDDTDDAGSDDDPHDDEDLVRDDDENRSTDDEVDDVVDPTTTPTATSVLSSGSGREALPETGADTGALARIAAAAIAFGLLTVALTRRRDARQ